MDGDILCGVTRQRSFRVAAVQASSVYLDRELSIEKACRLIDEAGRNEAHLAVFPEAFVPGYPVWVWFVPPGRTADLRSAYAALHANAISIPDDSTERLCAAARHARVAVAIGVNERNTEASGMSLFNTLLYIGPDGTILGKHRKLVPTGGERLVWASGDGSDLEVYSLPFARVGGLLCWEHYMPLARYALGAWGEQVHAAPTWDRGEPWLSTLKHVAKEGRAVVIGSCQAVRKDDIPDTLTFKSKYLADVNGWINPGGSVIIDPDGKILAGPALELETTLYADITTEQLVGPRWQLDVGGHYARPDVFELVVHRQPKPLIRQADAPTRRRQKARRR
ncbi:MAG TPA: carbon-nitrogen hydrolase family protein [Vicinamibacterales bacterium]|nr:carbon-nitrogen hydrolase family protein [Vicinamibacterales bacterium]